MIRESLSLVVDGPGGPDEKLTEDARSPSCHRQDPLPRSELWWRRAVEEQQPDHPTALAGIRCQQLEHPLVGPLWARPSRAYDTSVLEVVVTDCYGIRIADRGSEHRPDGPLSHAR